MSLTTTTDAETGVRQITLDRPEAYNAFDRGGLAELGKRLREAFEDDDVRGVVVTGAGRGFSAGQDLDEIIAELDLPHGGNDTRLSEGYGPVALLLGQAAKPVVAAVNGVAAGAGLALACLCSARVASPAASFAPAFIELGLVPDTGASLTIPALIGSRRAARWLVDGRRIDAATALAWGLVDAVVEPERLLEEARRTALRLASRDRRAVAATCALVAAAADGDLAAALGRETQEQVRATGRPEFTGKVRSLRKR